MGADRFFKLTENIRLDLLELYGSGYVIDHCISAFSEYQEHFSYCIYVTDMLRAIVTSGRTAEVTRWVDLITPQQEEPQNTEELAENIKARFINGLGGGVIECI